MATIETEAGAAVSPSPAVATPVAAAATPAPVAAAMPQETAVLSTAMIQNVATGRFYSPLVLNIAAQENIPMTELEALPGTGNEGRVTKKDILAYVAQRKAGGAPAVAAPAATPAPAAAPVPAAAPAAVTPAVSVSGNSEIIEMTACVR